MLRRRIATAFAAILLSACTATTDDTTLQPSEVVDIERYDAGLDVMEP